MYENENYWQGQINKDFTSLKDKKTTLWIIYGYEGYYDDENDDTWVESIWDSNEKAQKELTLLLSNITNKSRDYWLDSIELNKRQ